eukprot:TRINITY_DN29124_c0_g2_i1.p1 TRINITY_DN29124_c0_g2~~TRINITY_DN29124_c0_g2_i1.p1  ORF type:complete len:176 (+),score=35.23 TRINITY_DN29124_c0_g2_i1:58-585(+)
MAPAVLSESFCSLTATSRASRSCWRLLLAATALYCALRSSCGPWNRRQEIGNLLLFTGHRASLDVKRQRCRMGAGGPKLVNTQEERRRLEELGYSKQEAFLMRCELAAAVLERRTRRPWGLQSMPDAWKNRDLERSEEFAEILKRDNAAAAEAWRAAGGQSNSEPDSKETLPYLR